MVERMDTVTGVHIFPIKSCQEATADGRPIQALRVGVTGFEWGDVADRNWVIADPNNLFVSQRGWDENQARKHRDDRKLATVAIDIQRDHLVVGSERHGRIRVAYKTEGTKESTIRIFGPDLPVIDEGQEASDFFSDLLGRAVRLTKADRNRPRILPTKYHRQNAFNQSAGADGRPFSLASQASLDKLHDIVGWQRGTVPLNRFRANIDIDGNEVGPFFEDRMQKVYVGIMGAYVIKALARCPIPNIDQATGDDSQRLTTKLLTATRRGWAVGDTQTKGAEPFFAQSLSHYKTSLGAVVIKGDLVSVLEWGESNFIPKNND